MARHVIVTAFLPKYCLFAQIISEKICMVWNMKKLVDLRRGVGLVWLDTMLGQPEDF